MAGQGVSECPQLADYFVICGLDVAFGLELEPASEDVNEKRMPLDRPYKKRVLAHYPDNVSWNPFDEKAVGMLCMPSGLLFCVERKGKVPQPHYHTFVVTKEDGNRYFGYALTFYEEVSDEAVRNAIWILQEMHLAEVTTRRRPRTRDGTDYTSSLPRSMKLGSQKLSLAEDSAQRSGLFDISRDRLYVSKTLCYVSQHQFVAAFRTLLQSLYARCCAASPHLLPLESYVFNVLYEISTPLVGQSSRFHFYPDAYFVLQRPGEDEIPLFEYSLRTFFGLFGVEYAVDLVTCALLEHQILLCSKDHFLLMLVAECLNALLFPFSWQHVYVPILPDSMQSFLDAPVPFIMGLHRRDLIKDIPRTEGNVCFVDIDGQKIRLPEDVPPFPDRGEFVVELRDVIKFYGATLNTDFLQHRIHHKNRALPRKFSLTDLTEAVSFRPAFRREPSPLPTDLRPSVNLRSELPASPKKVNTRNTTADSNSAHMIPYIDDLRFNTAVREVFLNRFVHIFHSYDHFVLQLDSADYNRDNIHTFDKATFLSDQPDTHIPFLSPFLETQMFATFIDNEITALHDHEGFTLAHAAFHDRLNNLKHLMGESIVRTDVYQPCTSIEKMEQALVQRLKCFSVASPKPGKLPDMKVNSNKGDLCKEFRVLDARILNPTSQPILRPAVNVKRRETAASVHGPLKSSLSALGGSVEGTVVLSKKAALTEHGSSSVMATENWDFVEKLLKECKVRTKKMLVEKLKLEAVELGHNEDFVTGVEENTQIASLCDLLERVWSHGLHTKQGKSSLWSHLLYYQQRHEKSEDNTNQGVSVDPYPAPPSARSASRSRIQEVAGNIGSLSRFYRLVGAGKSSPDLTALTVDLGGQGGGDHGRRPPSYIGGSSMDVQPPSLIFDMRNVLAMPEIRSALGYARAWVRLSLEKKLLAKHLRALLADSALLETLYKRYAFLRNEDEREQFVFHLLSLNAVDFYCFTNTFVNTLVPYRVVFVPSRKYSSSMPATFWFCLGGALGDSGSITATKSGLQMVFQRKNLGLLTTIRIGLDKNSSNTKCLVDYILVRNEVTGHLSRFVCGRWLGRSVDDGSIERLLVVEIPAASTGMAPDSHASPASDHFTTSTLPRIPQRMRSPSANRRSTDGRFSVAEIEQMLGDAANSIVKYFYKPEKERASMTVLICGEMGMVFSLEQALLYGYSQQRLARQTFVWDVLDKCDGFFRTEIRGAKRMPPLRREEIKAFCRAVRQVGSSTSLGKDGKWQQFVALSLRDRTLDKWLELMRSCPIIDMLYERVSFLRDPELFHFLMDILNSLKDFRIVLEPAFARDHVRP
ncbi:DENN domain-containing protein 5A [Hypsibius exemplaris]|uniref:DENN domain-containing protein 5A n=1 Tax=Hypsibius exemplaris TaxID=2072580 RepID=A0A1W0WRL6_HYPEX|nr:DENN domain-containing protein 5A [Hypsibius exemplaris]